MNFFRVLITKIKKHIYLILLMLILVVIWLELAVGVFGSPWAGT